ncbi:MAG TPA: hypothetical protein VM094_04120 [Gemmatimonadales bacterium]|nr:hypothetical protein [Gemmatimonadales bacterium]
MKILLGAVGIFAIGMIGVSIVRGIHGKIHSVVEGDGPITIPLGLIPFVLAGERLGNLDHVTLHRDSPSHVTGVELEVKLGDSLLAQGLSGCRLAALFEGDSSDPGVNIRVARGRNDKNAFHCLPGDSTPPDLVEYGVAIFQPGDVEVPLLIPLDVVSELQSLDFADDSARASTSDSFPGSRGPNADSIKADVTRQLESMRTEGSRAESIRSYTQRFADSIRAEARKRMAEEADSQ